jgi:hypothetical protein
LLALTPVKVVHPSRC